MSANDIMPTGTRVGPSAAIRKFNFQARNKKKRVRSPSPESSDRSTDEEKMDDVEALVQDD